MSINMHWKKIKDWLYNHRRGSNSGTGTRGTLKLGTGPRLLQSWQAYQKLFSDELKPRVQLMWQDFLRENPGSAKTLFQFRNEQMQVWYDESSPDVKKQVEEYRQHCKEGVVSGDDDVLQK